MRRSRLYLLASALQAAETAGALRFVALPGPLSLLSFQLLPVSELPLQHLSAVAVGTALALRRGAVKTPAGRAGLALSAASAVGLIELERRGRESGKHLEAALAVGLGADYHSMIRRPRLPEPGAAVARRAGVVRMWRIRSSYAHDADISYGPHGTSNLLDIWRRPDLPRDAGAPVLLQVPGGAWITGNKAGQAYPLMSHLAETGWVCVSMSYRLSPKATWPAQIVDVKRALVWVKEHIADYGGDPRFVAITGGSAGGHLSALAALSSGDPAFQPGLEDADTTVQAAIPFYGIYDWTPPSSGPGFEDFLRRFGIMKQSYAEAPELYQQASPVWRVGPNAPPMFVLHGGFDAFAPVRQARELVERLGAQTRKPLVYAELPGAQHAFDIFGSARATAAAEAVERFLGVVYGQWLCAQAETPVTRG